MVARAPVPAAVPTPHVLAAAKGGIGRRFAAFALDLVLLWVVGIVFGSAAGIVDRTASDPISGELSIGWQLPLAALTILYYVWGYSRWSGGQTLGKRALGLRVVGSDGNAISPMRAVGRLLAEVPGALLLGVGYLWIAFDRQRQGWHDKLAETYVLRVGPAPIARTAAFSAGLLVVSVSVVIAATYVGEAREPRVGVACPPRGLPHQDPELEAVMPQLVGGRPLSIWSVRGRCWPVFLSEDPAPDERLAELEAMIDGLGIDLENISYAAAGRSDVERDPPYFVHAMRRPANHFEAGLALGLFYPSVGLIDSKRATAPGLYREAHVGGREVLVGGDWMLEQSVHQRGRPYVLETDEYLFLVVTDDEAWADDAIRQLP
jgi:uncharacterized RDD family membrane protein YckC